MLVYAVGLSPWALMGVSLKGVPDQVQVCRPVDELGVFTDPSESQSAPEPLL